MIGHRTPPRARGAVQVAAVYTALATLWIVTSDTLTHSMLHTSPALGVVESGKGIGFVLVTGTGLFLAVRHYLAHVERAKASLVAAYDDTLAGWAAAVDLRDSCTAQHLSRVSELATALGARAGMRGEDLENMRRGALLHDIGKLALPDAILNKTGSLDDTDWRLMRQHPEYAARMLASIAYLAPVVPMVRGHHERWDGTGYPDGLAGEQIPLPARLFTVIDVYDALTSDRPYRQALSHVAAMELLHLEAGTHFDPAAVDAFTDLMAERHVASASGVAPPVMEPALGHA
jgi:putative nucleotidyltransferase with HDIG domain